jgi:diguanylate cyclase (GGDEF)-like protein
MFQTTRWWLMAMCVVLGGIAWFIFLVKKSARRARVAEELRLNIIGQLARGEPLERILALLTRGLAESFSRIRCIITLAGPVYSSEDYTIGEDLGTSFPIVDTRGSRLGALTVYPAMAKLTRQETKAVDDIRHLAAIVAEQQSIYGELQISATQDRLTGLINGSMFSEALRRLMENALPDTTLALFVFDLDSFNRIYDRLGRGASDIYLKQAAERIAKCFRDGDLVARLGADGFEALATGVTAAEAGRICRSVINVFSTPFIVEGLRIASCIRIGVSAFPQSGRSLTDLRFSADAALTDAKKGSGSRFTISSPEIRERARSVAFAERSIRQALEDNQSELFYQPQRRLNGDLAGMEALVRIRTLEQLPICGNTLSPTAGRAGLVSEIGSWILPEAMRQYAEWLRMGLIPVPIAVKLPQLHLSHTEVFDQILLYLRTFGLDPNAIQIELPESASILSDETSLKMLKQLRSAGISVILDVFARGYSSLSCLNGLPVDAIKINQSSVRVLKERDGSMPLISAMIASAHALRMDVIADGIESEEQMWLLRRMGCDVLQGCHIAPPLNAKAAADRLVAR